MLANELNATHEAVAVVPEHAIGGDHLTRVLMDRHTRSKMNVQIYEEACVWFVESRARDLNEASQRDFDGWLRKSPEHLSSYLEIAAIWMRIPADGGQGFQTNVDSDSSGTRTGY
jgi:ferric-dicitrate binding protein FerR (iron transport regulator)